MFSGIGGFDFAAERAGLEVLWQSEINKKASKVLDYHWPDLNKGDIREITSPPTVDVLCGGFPCQSYSIMGSRGGLADDRGALWWEFLRLIKETSPTWVVAENVQGLLSSSGSRDFTTIVRSLVQCGYGVAWRVLDSQNWGVPQRRKRVFVVAHIGGVPRPEILDFYGASGVDSETSSRQRSDASSAHDSVAGYQIQAEIIGRSEFTGPNGLGVRSFDQPSYTLNVSGGPEGIATADFVRMLTPIECERLQGFPDGWTDVDGASDHCRYRQIANAVTVPVAEWVMKRIASTQFNSPGGRP